MREESDIQPTIDLDPEEVSDSQGSQNKVSDDVVQLDGITVEYTDKDGNKLTDKVLNIDVSKLGLEQLKFIENAIRSELDEVKVEAQYIEQMLADISTAIDEAKVAGAKEVKVTFKGEENSPSMVEANLGQGRAAWSVESEAFSKGGATFPKKSEWNYDKKENTILANFKISGETKHRTVEDDYLKEAVRQYCEDNGIEAELEDYGNVMNEIYENSIKYGENSATDGVSFNMRTEDGVVMADISQKGRVDRKVYPSLISSDIYVDGELKNTLKFLESLSSPRDLLDIAVTNKEGGPIEKGELNRESHGDLIEKYIKLFSSDPGMMGKYTLLNMQASYGAANSGGGGVLMQAERILSGKLSMIEERVVPISGNNDLVDVTYHVEINGAQTMLESIKTEAEAMQTDGAMVKEKKLSKVSSFQELIKEKGALVDMIIAVTASGEPVLLEDKQQAAELYKASIGHGDKKLEAVLKEYNLVVENDIDTGKIYLAPTPEASVDFLLDVNVLSNAFNKVLNENVALYRLNKSEVMAYRNLDENNHGKVRNKSIQKEIFQQLMNNYKDKIEIDDQGNKILIAKK